MEPGVEVFAALMCFGLGVSHIAQPRAWAELFLWLSTHGDAGAFVDGFLNFLLGTIVVSFHNVWHGLAMAVTIFGWGLTIKGFRIMVFPQGPPSSYQSQSVARARLDLPAGRSTSRGSEWPVFLRRAAPVTGVRCSPMDAALPIPRAPLPAIRRTVPPGSSLPRVSS